MNPHGDGSQIAAARMHTGIEYIKDHLERAPAVVAFRVGRLWGVYRPRQMAWLDEADGRAEWASLTATAMTPFLLLLGAWGVVSLVRRRTAVLPIVAPILLATLSGALFFGSTRHRAIGEPELVVLAAVGINQLIVRFFDSSPRRSNQQDAGARPTPG